MTQEQLNKIVENHQHYLNKDVDGWENMKADLSHQDLMDLDLSRKDLRNAIFYNTNLCRANLYNTNLCRANLRNTDLRGASLCEANLENTDFSYANLNDAAFYYADLSEVNFRHTDLSGADFYHADLRGVDLSYANLYGADLRFANLRDTKIDYPIACPETGSFIGYKKAFYKKIVKLQICEDAKRSSATTKKCRCSKALVLAIENIDGSDSGLQEIKSYFDFSFIYRVGKIVEVSDFDDNRWNECAPGIHFFMDRQDAIDYEI